MIFRVDVKNSFGEWVEVMNTFGCYESDNFKTLIKAKDLMAHLKSVGCLESDMRVIKTKDNV